MGLGLGLGFKVRVRVRVRVTLTLKPGSETLEILLYLMPDDIYLSTGGVLGCLRSQWVIKRELEK